MPPKDYFSRADKVANNMKTDSDDKQESWTLLLQVILAGQLTPNGQRNLEEIPRYLDNDVVGIWQGIKGNLIMGSLPADASGKASIDRLQPGPVAIVYALKTDKGFYVWTQDATLAKASHLSLKAVADGSDQSGTVLALEPSR